MRAHKVLSLWHLQTFLTNILLSNQSGTFCFSYNGLRFLNFLCCTTTEVTH
jgi:hypothetical protein